MENHPIISIWRFQRDLNNALKTALIIILLRQIRSSFFVLIVSCRFFSYSWRWLVTSAWPQLQFPKDADYMSHNAPQHLQYSSYEAMRRCQRLVAMQQRIISLPVSVDVSNNWAVFVNKLITFTKIIYDIYGACKNHYYNTNT